MRDLAALGVRVTLGHWYRSTDHLRLLINFLYSRPNSLRSCTVDVMGKLKELKTASE